MVGYIGLVNKNIKISISKSNNKGTLGESAGSSFFSVENIFVSCKKVVCVV